MMKNFILFTAIMCCFSACKKTSAVPGTAFKNESALRTAEQSLTVTDIDGNVYATVVIGTQTWLKKNLKVTHFRNGDKIARVTDATAGNNPKKPAYSNYNNLQSNANTYGRLYNWNAVADQRNIAPEGWHIATDAEWNTLITYLGGDIVAGGKLKEAGLAHWLSPNADADNSSGFTALPGGELNYYGGGLFVFNDIGVYEPFWTSTAADKNSAWSYSLLYVSGGISRANINKFIGCAVRCIKD